MPTPSVSGLTSEIKCVIGVDKVRSNYAVPNARSSESQQSRDALRHDLEGRIEYDVDILDRFLCVGVVSTDIVNRCVAKIKASDSIGDFAAVVVSRESNEVKYRETDMYEPLVSNSLLM
jgi:hypothetical protein